MYLNSLFFKCSLLFIFPFEERETQFPSDRVKLTSAQGIWASDPGFVSDHNDWTPTVCQTASLCFPIRALSLLKNFADQQSTLILS